MGNAIAIWLIWDKIYVCKHLKQNFIQVKMQLQNHNDCIPLAKDVAQRKG